MLRLDARRSDQMRSRRHDLYTRHQGMSSVLVANAPVQCLSERDSDGATPFIKMDRSVGVSGLVMKDRPMAQVLATRLYQCDTELLLVDGALHMALPQSVAKNRREREKEDRSFKMGQGQ
ncbi:hypothetical protein SARC_15464, partial [Sphaeroforma arctica JP610]